MKVMNHVQVVEKIFIINISAVVQRSQSLLLAGYFVQIVFQNKPNKYFTLCFQNKDFNIWKNVIEKCKQLGFSLVDVEIYDVFGSPFNKHWAKFSPKADLYVTFKKSTIAESNIQLDCKVTMSEIIEDSVNFMKENNIKIDLSRLYDITVSYIIWTLYACSNNYLNNFSVKSVLTEIEKYSLGD